MLIWREEQARRSMSDAINKDLHRGSVDVSLQEIDEYSSDPDFVSKSHHVVGPFSVLNFSRTANLPEDGDVNAGKGNSDTSAYLTPPGDHLPIAAGPAMTSFADGLLQ